MSEPRFTTCLLTLLAGCNTTVVDQSASETTADSTSADRTGSSTPALTSSGSTSGTSDSATNPTSTSGPTDTGSGSIADTGSTSGSTGDPGPVCPSLGGTVYGAKAFHNPGNEANFEVLLSGAHLWALHYTNMCATAMNEYAVDFGGPPHMLKYGDAVDFALSRYDLGLGHKMTQTFGGPGDQVPGSLATDETGRIYIAGWFNGHLDIPSKLGDPNAELVHEWKAANKSVGFVAAFEPDGTYLGAKDLRSKDGWITLHGIDAADGRIVAAGRYNGTLDEAEAKSTCGPVPTDSSQNDMALIASYALDKGVVTTQWVQCASDLSADSSSRGYRVALDQAGRSYMAGEFFGEIAFGDAFDPASHASVVDDGDTDDYDGFIVAWDAQGEHRWHRTCASEGNDEITDLAVDSVSRVFLTGRVGDMQHCSDPQFIPGSTTTRGFVAAIDDSGPEPEWLFDRALALDPNTDSVSWLNSVDLGVNDACQELAVAGHARGETWWEDGEPGVSFGGVPANLDSDIIVATLGADGSSVWDRRLGSSGYDNASSVTTDATGSVYVGGSYGAEISEGLPEPWTWEEQVCAKPESNANAYIVHFSP